jgi:ribosomal protein S18 acetylase RimI-like enzyme
MSNFAVSPARVTDAGALVEVYFDSRRVAMPWLAILHSRDDVSAYFAGQVIVREEVLVADVDNRIVGFIALEENHVNHLYIAPAYQGRGIGGRLLALVKELRPGGLKLRTFQRNAAARRFYEARGFAATDFSDGSYNEEHEPDILYSWDPD